MEPNVLNHALVENMNHSLQDNVKLVIHLVLLVMVDQHKIA